MSQAKEDATDIIHITHLVNSSLTANMNSIPQYKKLSLCRILGKIVIRHCSKFQIKSFIILAALHYSMKQVGRANLHVIAPSKTASFEEML